MTQTKASIVCYSKKQLLEMAREYYSQKYGSEFEVKPSDIREYLNSMMG